MPAEDTPKKLALLFLRRLVKTCGLLLAFLCLLNLVVFPLVNQPDTLLNLLGLSIGGASTIALAWYLLSETSNPKENE